MKPATIAALRRKLLAWYESSRRELPWRRSGDPYRVWVSEVMLQQTRVETATGYFRRFVARFPDVEALAAADLQQVLKIWEGLGYYARARNLHRAAALVVQRHRGKVPDRWEDFRQLPGVGDYIAAAVLSIACGQPFAAVDGNAKRVLSRLLCIEAPVNRSASGKIFQQAAARLLDRRRPGAFNQAVMELGALVCRERQPACGKCPLQAHCCASGSGQVPSFPRREKTAAVAHHHVSVGVVFKNGRVLITRRKPSGLLGGLWEFPGGKIRAGETPAQACIREIREEVNLQVDIGRHLARVQHAYSHFRITMEVFCCTYRSGRVRRNGPVAHRWIPVASIDRYPFPGANRKFIPLLKQELEGF